MNIDSVKNIEKISKIDDDYLLFESSLGKKGICTIDGTLALKETYDDIIKFDNLDILLAKTGVFEYSVIRRPYYNFNFTVEYKSYNSYKCYGNYLVLSDDAHTPFLEDFTILDKKGNELLNIEGYAIDYLEENVFMIRTSDDTVYFNAENRAIFKADNIINYYNGGFGLYRKLDKYIYLDKNGEVAFSSLGYSYATDFIKSKMSGIYTAVVKRKNSNLFEVIDNEGNTLFGLNADKYKIRQTESDAFIIIDKESNYDGVIDLNGNIVIPPKFIYVDVTINGICYCYDGFKRDYYTLSGKKLDINGRIWFNDNNDNRDLVFIEHNRSDNYYSSYSYIDSDGKILFNNLSVHSIKPFYNNRAIVSRNEVSYEMNDPYEYTRFMVLDKNKNEIVFTYPTDEDDLTDLYTEDHSFYIGKLRDEDRYVVMNDSGKVFDRIISDIRPVIKEGYIITKIDNSYQLYQVNDLSLLNIFENDKIDSIDIITKYAIVIESNNRKYFCYLGGINFCALFKYELTMDTPEKSLNKQIRW